MDEETDISDWLQGDVALDVADLPVWIVDSGEGEIGGAEARGAVVISQTCDVLKPYSKRRYVKVARIVEVDASAIRPIDSFRQPRYAIVPSLRDRCLVADLDVVATVDKKILARWSRTVGCVSDHERRRFAYALARHTSRFAFPDVCGPAFSQLARWVERESRRAGGDDKEFLDAVEQIRIVACNLAAPEEAEFICVLFESITDDARRRWSEKVIPKMIGLIDPAWCPNVSFRFTTRREMTVAELMDSLRLDLETLSPD